MWSAGAAALAALLAYMELLSHARKPLSWKAGHWIVLRVGADAAAGFLAYGLISLAFGELSWLTPAWTALIAGLVGPALLRSQLSLLGSGDETAVGPATAFRRLQGHADRNIDDIGATVQSKWLYAEAVPVLSNSGGLQVVVTRSIAYVNSLDRLDEADRATVCAYIEDVSADRAKDDDKIVAIAQHLIGLGGQRLLRSIVRERKRRGMRGRSR